MNKLITALAVSACLMAMPAKASMIWFHEGGSKISHDQLSKTIDKTLDLFDNIEQKSSIKKLVEETLIVETMAGGAKYDYAAKHWRNYGIAQVKESTAKYLHDVLYKKDKKTFYTLTGLLSDNEDIVYNLKTNVVYSIAICAQYYQLRFTQSGKMSLATKYDRALTWKKYYNTYLGMGTPEIYLYRIKEYGI